MRLRARSGISPGGCSCVLVGTQGLHPGHLPALLRTSSPFSALKYPNSSLLPMPETTPSLSSLLLSGNFAVASCWVSLLLLPSTSFSLSSKQQPEGSCKGRCLRPPVCPSCAPNHPWLLFQAGKSQNPCMGCRSGMIQHRHLPDLISLHQSSQPLTYSLPSHPGIPLTRQARSHLGTFARAVPSAGAPSPRHIPLSLFLPVLAALQGLHGRGDLWPVLWGLLRPLMAEAAAPPHPPGV